MERAIQRSRLDGERRPVNAASTAEMVARWAAQTPDAPAIIHGARTLGFGEVLARAALVADRLAEAGVGEGDRVALWVDRTPDVLCAGLGIWLARCAYVPIDPSYPHDRVRAILDAATPALLVHDGDAPGRRPPDTARPFDVAQALAAEDRRRPERPRLPESGDAAYVIFTSGSTGVPKGVVVEHASVVNYVTWCGSRIAASGSGAPLFGNMGFDHAVTPWWVPLAHGRPVELIAGTWDQAALWAPRADRWSFLKMTPSHARLFERLAEPDYGAVTESLMLGGELLRPELIEQLAERLAGVRILNHYGPTETTVGCCVREFTADDVPGTLSVPIGRPVWNARAYVVDDELRLVRPGEPGELVMAGASIARGYLHADERQRFIDEGEVESGEPGGRAYRTGDVVELLPEGELGFLGRVDDQFNIGGYRIEREELRRHALSVPGISEAAFEVVEGDVDVVRATVVADPGADCDEVARAVRRTMREALPAAVVPKAVDVVDRLTVNANGKLDLRVADRA